MLFLYKKTHNKTGLKYLGKTQQDPYKYKGSGTYWTRHLAIHGNDVSTEILLETEDPNELKQVGIYYSTLWNVVDSDEWANLKLENGDGGWDHINMLDKPLDHYKKLGRNGHERKRLKYEEKYGDASIGFRISAIKGSEKRSKIFKQKFATDPTFKESILNHVKEMCDKALSEDVRQKRKDTFAKIRHQQGNKNSMYGTRWIHSIQDKVSTRILKHAPLPEGWSEGRKTKF